MKGRKMKESVQKIYLKSCLGTGLRPHLSGKIG